MGFFNGFRKRNVNVRVADVFVVKAQITSSYNDGSGWGPQSVRMYFLATCKNGEYYELFSGKKLEKTSNSKLFDTPYIEDVTSFSKYLQDPNKKKIDLQSLFDFITNMNVMQNVGAFSEHSDS